MVLRGWSVCEQERMIADLEAISRRRPLSSQESDLLAELVRRERLRCWWRDRRKAEQLDRAAARYRQLAGKAVAA